jgi:hypothetical protein
MRCVIVAKSPIEGWRSSILPVTVSGRTCYRPPAFAPRMTLGAARRSPSTAAGRGQKEAPRRGNQNSLEIRGIRKKWPSEQQSFVSNRHRSQARCKQTITTNHRWPRSWRLLVNVAAGLGRLEWQALADTLIFKDSVARPDATPLP